MGSNTKCRIVPVGKRRDGGTRYWCVQHLADATAKYGRPGQECRHAHFLPIRQDDVLTVNVDEFRGGVALWGSVEPVYDTTILPAPLGVHVHARRTSASRKKAIDETYRLVVLRSAAGEFAVTEHDAVYNMVSRMFGLVPKYILCSLCGHPHLDKDWFSVHKHQTHLCAGCGRLFRDEERAVGNPVAEAIGMFDDPRRRTTSANRAIKVKQKDYQGGVQIWGSNSAIVWTAARNEEEGIHIHAYKTDDPESIALDDTYSVVEIDGVRLLPQMIRILMAQNSLPHIAGRVIAFNCPRCDTPHFDAGENAFTPHQWHSCSVCDHEFQSKARFRKTIGNPAVRALRQLEPSAPRPRRIHKTSLLVEANAVR